jgi:tetratricopeptide (TPR) repeat protein
MEESRMKIRIGLVLAMAVLFGVTGCASGGGGGGSVSDMIGDASGQGERPRDTDNTRAAEEALEDGDDAEDEAAARAFYQQALTSGEAAIAEDPRNPLAYRLAALAALSLEDYYKAGEYFDEAAELRPLYEFEHQNLREQTWIDLYQEAAPLVQSGDYESATEIFEQAHAIYQGRPEVMITLGQLYAQLRQHDRALEMLDAAEAFRQSETMAVADSATAESWNEQMADVPMLRAQVLADAGRLEEAAVAFRGLTETHPENLEYVRALASIHMQMGNEAEALAVYEDLLTRPGLTGPDYYAVGVGFYQADDYTRAAEAFAEAADVNRRDRDALEMWARSAQLDSAFTAVPPVAERWIELDPNSQNAYLILAQAANANGDQERTREAVAAVEALEVAVDQLQLRRNVNGGGSVSGVVINKTLSQGQPVTLTFTFYGSSGSPIGTVTETVNVGNTDMSEVFTVDFQSAEQIAGYGYELTVG